jgi:hypothetical protein
MSRIFTIGEPAKIVVAGNGLHEVWDVVAPYGEVSGIDEGVIVTVGSEVGG